MKKIIWIVSLAILAISCSKEVQVVNDSAQERVFARIESSSEPDTKVFADDKLRVLWDANDRISLFNKYTFNKQYRFKGETGANSGEFEEVNPSAVVTGNELEYVYSVYPYNEGTTISDDGIISLNLPSEQTYKEESFGLGANTMISTTENTNLLFKNLCGYIVLKLYGEDVSVRSITLKGNDNEPLAGPVRVSSAVGDIPSFTFSGSNSQSITLTCPTPVTLGSTAEEATIFWLVVPPTSYSKGFTITVTGKNGGTFVKSTNSEVTINRNSTFRMKALEVNIDESEPVAVDLGLSVKWATFNVGATSPEEFGNYYAFGETKGYGEEDPSNSSNFAWNNYSSYVKTDFLFDTYKWNAGGSYLALTKYSDIPKFGYKGFTDNKTVLEPQDDAASVNWDINWRTPTKEEWEELADNSNCTWVLETINGIAGYRVTSKKAGFTDASIFLPLAGHYAQKTYYNDGTSGTYMSATIYELPQDASESSACQKYSLRMFSEPQGSNGNHFMGVTFREIGNTVRPVYDEPENGVLGIELNQSTLRLNVNETAVLSTTVFPENAQNKSLTWSSSDASVATVNSSGSVTALKMGTTIITVTTVDNNRTAACIVDVVDATGAIDLGLSVRWAAFNVGATTPEEYGDYFAWGETEPYYQPGYAQSDVPVWKSGKEAGYDNSSYIWSNGSSSYTRYSSSDGKTDFSDYDFVDDAARANWGGSWRTPTQEEWRQLQSQCDWIWTTQDGKNGYLVTSKKNGNSIFLPAAGHRSLTKMQNLNSSGTYMQSTSNYVTSLNTNRINIYGIFNRTYGSSVRPVTE